MTNIRVYHLRTRFIYMLKKTIADSADYKQNYDQIKVRPLDINTKGEFPTKV